MTPRTLLTLAALASAALVLAALLHGDDVAADGTLASTHPMGEVGTDLPQPPTATLGDSAARTSASAEATPRAPAWTRPQALSAVARGEEPPGFGRLHVEARREGVLLSEVLVALRGTADSIQVPDLDRPWSYYVRAGSHVVVDVTDKASGWVQTETTVAPPAGEERTLTVQLDPPEIDGAILLRFVSLANGAPVAGAQVIAISHDPPDFQQQTSDASGRARVPMGPNFSYVITAPGHAALELPAFKPGSPVFQTHEMVPFARIFGRVHASLHPSRTVDLVQREQGSDPSPMRRGRVLGSSSVLTGGTWEIGGLIPPSGSDRITDLGVLVVMGGTRRSIMEGLSLGPGDSVEILDRAVPQGSVTLEFVYPSGRSLALDLPVLLSRTRPAMDSTDQETEAKEHLRGTLDDQGHITLPSLAPGPWTCRIHALEPIELVVSGDAVQTIVLEGRTMISGRVVTTRPESSDPNALWLYRTEPHVVTLTGAASLGTPSNVLRTGQTGGFRFELVPAGSSGKLQLGTTLVEVVAGDTDVVLNFTAPESDRRGDFFLRGENEKPAKEYGSPPIF
ncbi:MAG: hypothetical protein ACJA2W_001598 [Planctomycetota bacterium]|jgi:hypothetical protein